eukprot:TRINITY_DN16909_c0_g1_i1.p1 TRINITY_DN16909_c0_g1~~TRINITY_DN16909_c0_g1_i1.p1  ORF type:complete len:974 (-),score=185.10 TRINITY_DN16909_c0_g1_i1:431-3352(-)
MATHSPFSYCQQIATLSPPEYSSTTLTRDFRQIQNRPTMKCLPGFGISRSIRQSQFPQPRQSLLLGTSLTPRRSWRHAASSSRLDADSTNTHISIWRADKAVSPPSTAAASSRSKRIGSVRSTSNVKCIHPPQQDGRSEEQSTARSDPGSCPRVPQSQQREEDGASCARPSRRNLMGSALLGVSAWVEFWSNEGRALADSESDAGAVNQLWQEVLDSMTEKEGSREDISGAEVAAGDGPADVEGAKEMFGGEWDDWSGEAEGQGEAARYSQGDTSGPMGGVKAEVEVESVSRRVGGVAEEGKKDDSDWGRNSTAAFDMAGSVESQRDLQVSQLGGATWLQMQVDGVELDLPSLGAAVLSAACFGVLWIREQGRTAHLEKSLAQARAETQKRQEQLRKHRSAKHEKVSSFAQAADQEHLGAAKEAEALRATIVSKERTRKELKDRAQEQENDRAALTVAIARTKSEIETAIADTAIFSRKLVDVKSRERQLTDDVGRVTAELTSRERTVKELERFVGFKQSEVQRRRAAVDSMTETVKAEQQQLLELKAEMEQAGAQIISLGSTLPIKEQEVAEVVGRIGQAELAKVTADARIRQLEEVIKVAEGTEQKASNQAGEIETLKREVDKVVAQLAEQRNVLAALSQRLITTDDAAKEREKKVAELEGFLKSAGAKEAVEGEVNEKEPSQLESSVEDLERSLKEVQAKVEGLSKSVQGAKEREAKSRRELEEVKGANKVEAAVLTDLRTRAAELRKVWETTENSKSALGEELEQVQKRRAELELARSSDAERTEELTVQLSKETAREADLAKRLSDTVANTARTDAEAEDWRRRVSERLAEAEEHFRDILTRASKVERALEEEELVRAELEADLEATRLIATDLKERLQWTKVALAREEQVAAVIQVDVEGAANELSAQRQVVNNLKEAVRQTEAALEHMQLEVLAAKGEAMQLREELKEERARREQAGPVSVAISNR